MQKKCVEILCQIGQRTIGTMSLNNYVLCTTVKITLER